MPQKNTMPPRYLPGLDVVRLLALLPVLCYHFFAECATAGLAVPAATIGQGMAAWVEVGLAWFFLLSGTALCLQWRGRFALRPYLAGRAAAMYPAFWLGFGVLFVYGEILHGNNPEIPRWRVIFSVLGLDGYLAPATATFYKIGEWFLGVILILYLIFPLILWCMEVRARCMALAAALVALQLAWPYLCPVPFVAGHTVLGRLPVFAAGVWFGVLMRDGCAPGKKAVAGGVLVAGVLCAVDLTFPPRAAVLMVLAAGLFWPVFWLGQRWPVAACGALRRAAGLCYCAYLTHHVLLTIVLVPWAARLGLPLWGMFPVFLVATVASAWALQAVSAPVCKAMKKALAPGCG